MGTIRASTGDATHVPDLTFELNATMGFSRFGPDTSNGPRYTVVSWSGAADGKVMGMHVTQHARTHTTRTHAEQPLPLAVSTVRSGQAFQVFRKSTFFLAVGSNPLQATVLTPGSTGRHRPHCAMVYHCPCNGTMVAKCVPSRSAELTGSEAFPLKGCTMIVAAEFGKSTEQREREDQTA